MKKPLDIRATRMTRRRVYLTVVEQDPPVRRTTRQKRVVVRNRLAKIANWVAENGVGKYWVEDESLYFLHAGDAALFYLAFA